jgi:hypothetical protein
MCGDTMRTSKRTNGTELKGLEQITKTLLYEVTSSGNSIEHDSPYCGMTEEVNRWKKHHGYFRSAELAKEEHQKIIKKFMKDGYDHFDDSHDERFHIHLGTMTEDAYIRLDMIQVAQDEIFKNAKKEYMYDGKKVM